jgi:predicted metalloprotease with PDZ domain
LKTLSVLSLAAAASLLCAASPPESRTIHYRARPALAKDGAPALQVDIRFRGDGDGETILNLPSQWAGSTELWRHVSELEIRGAKSLGGYFDRPIIRHKPGATIRVRYKLLSAYAGDPGFAYEKARPLIRPDWFFIHGEGMFAFPEGRFAAPARFIWGKTPSGWTIASDLDHLKGRKTTVANMINSVAIGGLGLNVIRRDIGGAPLRVAVLGQWDFRPEALADLVARVVVAGNSFWGDRAGPYLVAMAPLGRLPAGLSFTGTGRADAFSIASTSAFDLKQATRFLGHEYTHGWIPIELGEMPEENEAKDYWFSEGFDDYIASKLLLRTGLWSLAEFVEDKNKTLLRYGTSPARTADAATVAERFWTDDAVQQVSYDRGHLLAAILDSEIQAKTGGAKSLDDVLRAQRKAAKGSKTLAVDLFSREMRELAGIDVEPDVDRYARRGEAIGLPAGLYGECARIVTERRRDFTRGYDSQATRIAGGIIAGVAPDGPAYAAGMRDGMKLVRLESGKIGDSSVELVYRVSDDSGERLVRYMPEGKAEFDVQRVELTAEGPEQQAKCRALLGGPSAQD